MREMCVGIIISNQTPRSNGWSKTTLCVCFTKPVAIPSCDWWMEGGDCLSCSEIPSMSVDTRLAQFTTLKYHSNCANMQVLDFMIGHLRCNVQINLTLIV